MTLVAASMALVGVAAWRCRPLPASGDRRRPSGPRAAGRALLGVSVAVAVALAGVGPVIAIAALVAGARWQLGRRVARYRAQALAFAIPELVDQFLVAAAAGVPVASSLLLIAPRAPAVVRPSLQRAAQRFERGVALGECLGSLGPALGPDADGLVDALRRSATSGADLEPLLVQVAGDARSRRRAAAQAAARRLPVAMLLPLAGCILPAAIVLAVVPVLLVSLAALRP